jgi:hypothetical protein
MTDENLKLDGYSYRQIERILDEACETMELAGFHEYAEYQGLKTLHAELMQQNENACQLSAASAPTLEASRADDKREAHPMPNLYSVIGHLATRARVIEVISAATRIVDHRAGILTVQGDKIRPGKYINARIEVLIPITDRL